MISLGTNCSDVKKISLLFPIDMKFCFSYDDCHRYELLRPGGRLYVSVPDFPTYVPKTPKISKVLFIIIVTNNNIMLCVVPEFPMQVPKTPKFSKVLSILPLCSTFTRPQTFQIIETACAGSTSHFVKKKIHSACKTKYTQLVKQNTLSLHKKFTGCAGSTSHPRRR
jgi:hypothetical protein